jgi:hypothetical protein
MLLLKVCGEHTVYESKDEMAGKFEFIYEKTKNTP